VLAFFGLCYARGLLGASKFDAKVGKFSTICLKNTGYCRSQKLFFKKKRLFLKSAKKLRKRGGDGIPVNDKSQISYNFRCCGIPPFMGLSSPPQ